MAEGWVTEYIKQKSTEKTGVSTPVSKTTSVPSPVARATPNPSSSLTSQALGSVANFAWNNPISPIKQTRDVFGGLGWVGKQLAKPQQYVEKKLTGGMGYQKYLTDTKTGQNITDATIKYNPYLSKNTKKIASENKEAARKGAATGLAIGGSYFLDPLNLVGAGVVSKISKATKVANYIPKIEKIVSSVPGYQKVRDAIGEFQYGYKIPKPFLGKYEELQRNTGRAAEYATKIATPLKYDTSGKELPKVVQRMIGDILSGNERVITPEDQVIINRYRPVVDRTLQEFEKLAKEQIKRGADPAIFERFLGKYYGKRMYSSKIDNIPSGKRPRLDLSVYKERQDIPEEVRKQLGEVKEPAYGAATAAYAEKKNLATKDFFRWVAKKYVNQGEDLVQLPKTERLGVLSGQKVPKRIKTYIDQVVESPQNDLTEKVTSFFKKGKTIYSPKQLFRNMITSQVQAYLNPSGSSTSIFNLPEAINNVRKKGKYYQELKSTGEIGGTFANELNRFAPSELGKFKKSGIISKIGNIGSRIQQKSEEISKLQVFINARKEGKSVAEARKMAEETGFNYQKVSPKVANLRSGRSKLGPLPFSVPFITYPLKAAELTTKTLIKHPERLANIGKTERAVQSLSQSPDERYLPEYLKDSVRLPVKNKKTSNNYYLNAKYMYPFGNLQEISPLPLGLTPDPIYQEILSQTMGKDVFTGKKFGDSPGVIGVVGRARHAAETFGPTPLRSGTKLLDVATKNIKYSTSPNMTEAILQELGLPIYQYSPKEGAKFDATNRYYESKDARSALNNFRKNYQGKLPLSLYNMGLKYYQDAYRKSLQRR